MRWVMMMTLVGGFGCGRFGFELVADAADGPASPVDAADARVGLADAPKVPAQICKVTQIAAPTPAIADLAIAATTEGYAAMWVNTQQGGDAYGVQLAADHQPLGARELDYLTDTRLAGLIDTGTTLMIASATGTVETMRSVSRDLAGALEATTRKDVVPSRDPFVVDIGNTTRGWASGSGGDIQLAYIADDGTIGETGAQLVRNPKRELACTYGPDHGHCAWVQDPDPSGGPSECVITDILFGPMARVDSSVVFDGDCLAPRLAPGASVVETLAVWTTTTGRVKARYPLRTPGIGAPLIELATSGSAPKVQHDGVRFWIAWIDPTGTLQLASFEESSSVVSYPMPGWVPNGPEAFELARRTTGNKTEVVLAVLREGELDVLTLCPP